MERHALVIGGGVAGLLAARGLTDHFERVTLVERDALPETPSPRRGAPQARHVHVLLQRGLLALEQMFPGLTAELIDAGATSLDAAADFAWLTAAGWAPRFASQVSMLACSRDLLEWSVRRRLTSPGLRRLDGVETTGLIQDAAGQRITGVMVRPRGSRREEQRILADLVVDASGRTSRTPEWLAALGHAPPRETVVDVGLSYASRVYRRAPGQTSPADWRGLMLQPAPPTRKRGGLMLPIEDDRWIVTLSGRGGEQPPVDEPGFLAYAQSLRSPMLYDAIAGAEPLSPIVGYRATANRLRHYEELSDHPDGVVVLGDAACAFNPVYGQGMTAAALGALLLGDCLAEQRHRFGAETAGLARRFQKRLAKLNTLAWLSATGEDCRYLPAGTPMPAGWRTRLLHLYLDRLAPQSMKNPELRRVLIEVFNMVRPPSALFRPRLICSALRAA